MNAIMQSVQAARLCRWRPHGGAAEYAHVYEYKSARRGRQRERQARKEDGRASRTKGVETSKSVIRVRCQERRLAREAKRGERRRSHGSSILITPLPDRLDDIQEEETPKTGREARHPPSSDAESGDTRVDAALMGGSTMTGRTMSSRLSTQVNDRERVDALLSPVSGSGLRPTAACGNPNLHLCPRRHKSSMTEVEIRRVGDERKGEVVRAMRARVCGGGGAGWSRTREIRVRVMAREKGTGHGSKDGGAVGGEEESWKCVVNKDYAVEFEALRNDIQVELPPSRQSMKARRYQGKHCLSRLTSRCFVPGGPFTILCFTPSRSREPSRLADVCNCCSQCQLADSTRAVTYFAKPEHTANLSRNYSTGGSRQSKRSVHHEHQNRPKELSKTAGEASSPLIHRRRKSVKLLRPMKTFYGL
ncbi:hypothetical protein R3P38DRAFT_2776968 [Favolaschia claudopus]|uniref:Uncharacterized protein n=1 Tax=Favolaschia claudopus TaxID=2862362 RepID=A0AAW0BNQ7_9AGAR